MLQQSGDEGFGTELASLIPQMRAFARSLCGGYAEAEDLAQDALARAWAGRAGYTPGTNLKAWTFRIVRNQFLSERRRSWRATQLDPEVAERILVATDTPSATTELDELRRAMALLPDEQREALILVGAGGLSYDEAADICRVAVGTIKSRVSRARSQLASIYAEGKIPRDQASPSLAMAEILAGIPIACN